MQTATFRMIISEKCFKCFCTDALLSHSPLFIYLFFEQYLQYCYQICFQYFTRGLNFFNSFLNVTFSTLTSCHVFFFFALTVLKSLAYQFLPPNCLFLIFVKQWKLLNIFQRKKWSLNTRFYWNFYGISEDRRQRYWSKSSTKTILTRKAALRQNPRQTIFVCDKSFRS